MLLIDSLRDKICLHQERSRKQFLLDKIEKDRQINLFYNKNSKLFRCYELLDKNFIDHVENVWINSLKEKKFTYWERFNYKVGKLLIENITSVNAIDLSNDLLVDSNNNKRLNIDDNNNSFKRYYDNRVFEFEFKHYISMLIPLICMILLLFHSILQFNYDKNLYRFEYLNSTLNENDRKNITIMKLLNDTKQLSDESERILINYGAPFINLHFTLECDLAFLNIVSIIIFFNTYYRVYHNKNNPIDFMLIRIILNREKFINYYIRLVAYEMNKFIASSQNLILKLTTPLIGIDSRHLNQYNFMTTNERRELKSIDIMNEYKQHYKTIEEIKLMLLEGKLIPINRQRKWLFYINVMYNLTTISAMLSIITILTIYWINICSFKTCRYDLLSCIVILELFIVIITLTFGIGFNFSFLFLATCDFICYVSQLNNEIDSCIKQNELLLLNNQTIIKKEFNFRSINDKSIIDKMNKDLLFIILQYQIYLSQFESTKPTIRYITNMTICSSVLSPILTFLQMPFVDINLRVLVFITFIVFVLFGDFLIAPVCILNSKCSLIQKKLFNLMGHISRFKNVYSLNTIKLIHREICNSNLRIDQFNIYSFGLIVNFNNFVRFHVYLLLILTYVYVINSKTISTDFYSSMDGRNILTDPLSSYLAI